MAKPYDATLKQLVDRFADDWATFLVERLELPAGTRAEPLDADLSTTSPQADKLFRLSGPVQGFIHLELQSRWAGELPDKLLVYNVLAEDRYGGPVRSVIVLLRPEANASNLSGELRRRDEVGDYLRFRYGVIRLWELSAQSLLEGPIGTLPLGLLTDEAGRQLDHMVNIVHGRLVQEGITGKAAGELWTACEILLGLRYDKNTIDRLFQGVAGMEDSVIYQDILQKGIAQGITQGISQGIAQGILKDRQDLLLKFGGRRLGAASAQLQDRIQTLRDADRLERMIERVHDAKSWEEVLSTP